MPTNRAAADVATTAPTAQALEGIDLADPRRHGLTEVDLARIGAALEANYAPSTRSAYASAWRRWQAWCADRDQVPLPATAPAVCAYLTERAAQGVSFGCTEMACSAIAYEHRRRGLPDPIADETVRRVRRGLRRTLGTAPTRPSRPLTVADLHRIMTGIDRTTAKGARDAALILLGFASALRRSELTALTLADLASEPTGLLLRIRRSKTDPGARGQIVAVAPGQQPATDPIAALDTWLRVRGTVPGPLFTSMRPGRAGDAITGQAVGQILKARAAAVGMPTTRITGHSLRAGHATTAARAGVPLDRIAAQTRHRRIDVLLERYIRPVAALETTSSRDLGL